MPESPGAAAYEGLSDRASRAFGLPVERLLLPQNLLATIHRYLGIDYRATPNDFAARPQQILSAGETIVELH